MTAAKLAEASGVSEATVIRFANHRGTLVTPNSRRNCGW